MGRRRGRRGEAGGLGGPCEADSANLTLQVNRNVTVTRSEERIVKGSSVKVASVGLTRGGIGRQERGRPGGKVSTGREKLLLFTGGGKAETFL